MGFDKETFNVKMYSIDCILCCAMVGELEN